MTNGIFGNAPRIEGENDYRTVPAGGITAWNFQVRSDGRQEITFNFHILTGPDAEDAPEWMVILYDSVGELWSASRVKNDFSMELDGVKPKDFKLELTAPNGARFGDTVSVTVEVSNGNGNDSLEFNAEARQSVLVLKTQIDQEKSVADSLASKSKIGDEDIYAILSPTNLRGYIIVEGMNTDHMREKVRDIRKARRFVDGETSLAEIDHYLTPLSTVVGIREGDLVELVAGPFKGEKARVQQIDQGKEEITVELVEAMVPIPVTIRGDHVRVIEKER